MDSLRTCLSCQGWDASETGYFCLLCGGEGVIWDDPADDDDDTLEAPDA